MTSTWYDVLGVPASAQHAEIVAAFEYQHTVAQAQLGSAAPGISDDAARRVAALRQAFDIVGDPVSRVRYDVWLSGAGMPNHGVGKTGSYGQPVAPPAGYPYPHAAGVKGPVPVKKVPVRVMVGLTAAVVGLCCLGQIATAMIQGVDTVISNVTGSGDGLTSGPDTSEAATPPACEEVMNDLNVTASGNGVSARLLTTPAETRPADGAHLAGAGWGPQAVDVLTGGSMLSGVAGQTEFQDAPATFTIVETPSGDAAATVAQLYAAEACEQMTDRLPVAQPGAAAFQVQDDNGASRWVALWTQGPAVYVTAFTGDPATGRAAVGDLLAE
jgi:hypothetical protein